MKPIVSIIIPCFNASSFIDQLIVSLNEMSFNDWECIFINNGSNDDTISKLEKLKIDKRFIILSTQQNGVSNARNLGLKQAQGKYIQFLDVDDLLQPDKLKNHVKFLEENPTIDIVFSDALYFNNDNLHEAKPAVWTIKAPVKELEGNGEFVFNKLLEGNRFVISSPLFRKEIEGVSKGFISNLNYNEDWEFWLRLAKNGAYFKYNDNNNSKSLIRIHANNSSKNITEMFKSELKIYKNLKTDSSISKKSRLIARNYYIRTWLEVIYKKFKGQPISISQLLKS